MSNEDKTNEASQSCGQETSSAAKDKPEQKDEQTPSTTARKFQSGLTQQLGKPIADSSDSIEKRTEKIESSYQQLKSMKKFAMSGISTAFGDLLGNTTERAKSIEEEKREEIARQEECKKAETGQKQESCTEKKEQDSEKPKE